jgi:hypothetical protein
MNLQTRNVAIFPMILPKVIPLRDHRVLRVTPKMLELAAELAYLAGGSKIQG